MSDYKLAEIGKMRPEKNYQKVLSLREKCGRDFHRKHQSRFIDVACPACGGEGGHIFFKYGFGHKKCLYCSTLYCSPRPTDELLFEYYEKWEAPNYWTDLLLMADIDRKKLQYQPRARAIVDKLRPLRRDGGHAVDVGAGSGAFALALLETGFFENVSALDFSKKCAEACEGRGVEAIHGAVDDLPDKSADLLTMNDLIEHVFSPEDFLTSCHKVLRKGGFLSIATPNGEGFDFKVLKHETENITPPEHLNYFNPRSIEMLLENSGFQVIDVQTPGILDAQIVAKKLMDSDLAIGESNEYIKYLLLDCSEEVFNNFQKFLADNLLSSHMMVMAQKT